MRCLWGDRGSVTAEFAVAFPAVALTLAACLGGVQVVGLQVRLTDAAADAARSVARGDEPGARTRVAAAVPNAGLTIHRDGDLVCALASAPAAGVGVLSAMIVSGSSCAIDGGL